MSRSTGLSTNARSPQRPALTHLLEVLNALLPGLEMMVQSRRMKFSEIEKLPGVDEKVKLRYFINRNDNRPNSKL